MGSAKLDNRITIIIKLLRLRADKRGRNLMSWWEEKSEAKQKLVGYGLGWVGWVEQH